ncbi:MAG: hypothetical protein WBD71_00820 [Xanthobacteraceae bacterium]
MIAPVEAAAEGAELAFADVARTGLYVAFDHFRGRVIESHVTAKLTVARRHQDIANLSGIVGGTDEAQQWIDGGMAAEQKRAGKKHQKKRGNDNCARRRRIFVPQRCGFARAQFRVGMIRFDEPCRTLPLSCWRCLHRPIKHQNDCMGLNNRLQFEEIAAETRSGEADRAGVVGSLRRLPNGEKIGETTRCDKSAARLKNLAQ